MSDRDHPFIVEVDMDYVVFTNTETGTVTSLTTEAALKLIDDVRDAVDGARAWTHYDGPDETWQEMENR